MEMIEDIPALGPVTASVRLPSPPRRVYDALTGDELQFSSGNGRTSVTVPRLKIHAAIVFEGA
jgi:hypothetical protein